MKKTFESFPKRNYKCMNCGYSKEVDIPCNSCSDLDINCPFCGELMMHTWEGYGE